MSLGTSTILLLVSRQSKSHLLHSPLTMHGGSVHEALTSIGSTCMKGSFDKATPPIGFIKTVNFQVRDATEWAEAYMNYASFKRLCKEPTASVNLPGKRLIQIFIDCLLQPAPRGIPNADRLGRLEIAARCRGVLDTIDQFYSKNYTSSLSKLSFKSRLIDPIHDIHAIFTGSFNSDGLDYVDLQYQKAVFTSLVTEFDRLRWYGRVNTDGFQSIIRKIRSLGASGDTHAVQVQKALCRLEFATEAQCLRVLENLQKIITVITQAQQNLPKKPSKVQTTFCIRLAKVNPFIPALSFIRSIEEDESLELEKLIDKTCKGDLGFSRTDFLYVLF